MTKSYRTYLRIKRDKELKERKRRMKTAQYDNYDLLITYEHFYYAFRKCLKNVSWKYSVQAYKQSACYELYKIITMLSNNKYPTLRDIVIKNIFERGKCRRIHSVHIRDRVPQRVLCDFALLPLLRDKLIYDNGASLAGKGVDFSRRRVNLHLQQAIKQYGTDFYVLKFDFKDFFNSIPHKVCREILSKYITDQRIVEMTMEIIKSYARIDIKKSTESPEVKRQQLAQVNNDEWTGLCLGSQVSQVMALIVPNALDHYIKDVCGFKQYDRYMDDGVIFAKTKEELLQLFDGMQAIVSDIELEFNQQKTYITHIKRGFTFLQMKYNVSDTGGIIRRLTRKGVVRMRRKLHKFTNLVAIGKMTVNDVYTSMQSWLGHVELARSYTTRKCMLALYNQLFGGYLITRSYYKRNGGKKRVLQTDKWAEFRWNSNV